MIFNDLELKWKILIIIGSICSILMIILSIILILIFNTNLIPIDNILSYKEDISEYDDFFEKLNENKDENKDDLKKVFDLVTNVSDDISKIRKLLS